MGELSCILMGTNGFKVKIENERFIVLCSRGRQNVKLGNFSTRVFETRTATGSELFSLLTCLHTTTFTS